jgi:hypothetical protein
MSQFTPLNVEQSVAKYLSTQFQGLGNKIYWHDTEQTEGSGSVEVTLLRTFPTDPTLLVSQSTTREVGMIKVPAFAIFMDRPETGEADRMGIGESLFEWSASIRIDGFVDSELEWYKYHNLFKDWFHIDVRIDLYDYEADINSTDPSLAPNKLHLNSTQVFRRELDYTNAARYYIFLSTTVTYIE